MPPRSQVPQSNQFDFINKHAQNFVGVNFSLPHWQVCFGERKVSKSHDFVCQGELTRARDYQGFSRIQDLLHTYNRA